MSKLRNVSEEILVGAKFLEVGKSAKLTRGQLLASKNVSLNLKKTETQYYVSQSKEELIGGYWVNLLPENYNGYVWTRIKYTYTNGKSTYTNPTYNLKESDVDTSFETVPHYLATSQSTGVTKNTQGWTTTVQSMTATNKYLWYYETIIFSTGEGSDSDCFIVGVYGDKGDTGATGATGVSITATTDLYAVNNSSSTAPSSGWGTFDNVKGQLSSSNQYLWNKEIITYSNGNESELTPHLIYRLSIDGQNGQDGKDGKDGVDGQDGQDGQNGQDGIGISGIEEGYSYGTASASSGNWGSDPLIPSSTTGQNYVWQRERVVFDTSPATYGSWSTPHMIAMWIKGDAGTPAYVFDIYLNTETYIRNLRLSGNNPTSVSATVILQGYEGTATVTITTSSGSTITPSAVGNTYTFDVPYTNNYDYIVITATHSVAGEIERIINCDDQTGQPIYLGELSAIPTPSAFDFASFISGDYFSCVQTNLTDGITAGIPYEYNGTSWNAMTFATKEQKVKAFTCLGGMLNSNVAIPSSATLYAWIGSLVAQDASIASLFAKLIEVGNAIYGGDVDLNASVGSRAYGKGFIMDSNGVMEISEGYARNMNVRGILNLYNEDGTSSGAEIYHPAITTVRGMAGDSTGVTADSPTRWKQSDLTDLITTQNTELAESGTYGSDTVTKLLKLTNLSTYKANNTITYSMANESGLDGVRNVCYGNNIFVAAKATQPGSSLNWLYQLAYSTDGVNFTNSFSYQSNFRYLYYCDVIFIDGYFYARLYNQNDYCFKSSDGINWVSIDYSSQCPQLSMGNYIYEKGNGIYVRSVRGSNDNYSAYIGNSLLGTYSNTGIAFKSPVRYSEVDKCFYAKIDEALCSSQDGTNWTQTGGTLPSSELFVCNGVLFSWDSNDAGLYSSVDEGVLWSKIGTFFPDITSPIYYCFDGTRALGYKRGNAYVRIATFSRRLYNITKDFLGKSLYLTGTTWKEIDPSIITTTSVSLSGSISFSSSSHINYRTLSNFLNYTSYTYTDGGETHIATIDVGITYRITSTGFKINNVSRNAIFFTRNSANNATIVCSDGTVLSFSSGEYYYVEGTIAIAETFDGVEMMGQYPKDDMIYDIGTPTKRWLTGYISNLPLTSRLSEKTGVIPFERSAIPLLNSVSVVRYRLKKLPDTPLIGFIADYTDSDLSGEKHDSMMVNNCLGVLIKAIQELSADVEELKSRIDPTVTE